MTEPTYAEYAAKRKSKRYYSLAMSLDNGITWGPDFGDYSRSVVQQELTDRKASGDHDPRTCYKIISSGDTQAEIDTAIAKLNPSPTARAFRGECADSFSY